LHSSSRGESDANLSRSSQALLTIAFDDPGPSSDCTVQDWIRCGDAAPVDNVPLASIRHSFTPRKTEIARKNARAWQEIADKFEIP
jgi:hypothetical protein